MEQIKGQLSFIEQPKKDDKTEIPKSYASPCGGCICNKCANDVNGRGKPDEMVFPCYNCDNCRWYNGSPNMNYNKRSECESFKITDYHAERNRARIRLLR